MVLGFGGMEGGPLCREAVFPQRDPFLPPFRGGGSGGSVAGTLSPGSVPLLLPCGVIAGFKPRSPARIEFELTWERKSFAPLSGESSGTPRRTGRSCGLVSLGPTRAASADAVGFWV